MFFRRKEKPVELLELKVNKYVHDVQESLDMFNVPVQISGEQMEKILNDILEVDIEHVKETEVSKGDVRIGRYGKGRYYSLKNIRLLYFMDLVSALFQMDKIQSDTKYMICIGVSLLLRLAEQLGIELTEEQTAICVALYQATKHCAVTEDNITQCIARELEEENYLGYTNEKIKKVLSELTNMGIVSVENGIYKLAEKVHIS